MPGQWHPVSDVFETVDEHRDAVPNIGILSRPWPPKPEPRPEDLRERAEKIHRLLGYKGMTRSAVAQMMDFHLTTIDYHANHNCRCRAKGWVP